MKCQEQQERDFDRELPCDYERKQQGLDIKYLKQKICYIIIAFKK